MPRALTIKQIEGGKPGKVYYPCVSHPPSYFSFCPPSPSQTRFHPVMPIFLHLT